MVAVTLDQGTQEEENHPSQETSEALMVNLEIVFLNQEEEAQDQVIPEDQKEVELADQVVVAADQTLVEDQVIPEDQKEVELADLVAIQQINHITKIQDQSQKLVGKRVKPFWSDLLQTIN
jgi:hypothetical protein